VAGRRKEKSQYKKWDFFEKYCPLMLSLVAALLYLAVDIEFKDNFSELLSASMSFASILIGFLGVLIALLFSLNNNAIRNYILGNSIYKKRMYQYFNIPVITGFMFVILSLALYLKQTIANLDFLHKVIEYVQEIFNIAWIFLFVYFITSSYRLIKIVLRIAFAENVNDELQEEENAPALDWEKYSRIQEEYAATKNKKKN